MKQVRINQVLTQIEHLYRSSHHLQRESIAICKELDNIIDDKNTIVAGFLSNFHNLFLLADRSYDKSARQLREYGFNQDITMSICLLKYISKNDPMSN